MKTHTGPTLLLSAVLLATGLMSCEKEKPLGSGPPTGVQVGTAYTDSTVQIVWNPPAQGTPNSYLVYFRPVHDSAFGLIAETRSVSFEHHPDGHTGVYKVAALFDGRVYEAADWPSTVPIHGDTVTIFELNADPSRSGYGWSRDSGMGRVYSMALAGNAANVDFYVSDLDTGHGRAPYVVVSPDQADTIDRGAQGIVPEADWRINGFAYPVADEQEPLPAYSSFPFNYFIYTSLDGTMPILVPCYTAGEAEKHYALIKVLDVDTESGTVKVESWFQLLQDLRLIEH